MDKKRALFHAIVTGITVALLLAIAIAIGFVTCLILEWTTRNGYGWLAVVAVFLIVAVIVGVSSYRYFRKED